MAFIPPNINFKFGVCRVFSIVWERGKVGLDNIAKGVAGRNPKNLVFWPKCQISMYFKIILCGCKSYRSSEEVMKL